MIVNRFRVVLLVDVVDGEVGDLCCLANDLADTLMEEYGDIEDVQVESSQFVEELPA